MTKRKDNFDELENDEPSNKRSDLIKEKISPHTLQN